MPTSILYAAIAALLAGVGAISLRQLRRAWTEGRVRGRGWRDIARAERPRAFWLTVALHAVTPIMIVIAAAVVVSKLSR